MGRHCVSVYHRTRYGSQSRGIRFLLDKDKFYEYWESVDKCHYCGITGKQYRTLIRRIVACKMGNSSVDAIRWLIRIHDDKFTRTVTKFTIDRIDSFKPYMNENVVKCCWICNSIKGRYIHGKLFKKIAKKIMLRIWKIVKKEHKKQGETRDIYR